MSTSHKKDIEYGTEDLLAEDEFDPKYGKERITILVDQQVVDAFREKAERQGGKYQTLMREALRMVIFGSKVEERLQRLEAKVFQVKEKNKPKKKYG